MVPVGGILGGGEAQWRQIRRLWSPPRLMRPIPLLDAPALLGQNAGMGLAIEREHFDEAEFPLFVKRLERSLVALRELMERPGFGEGPCSLGAEIELSLVDERGQPLPRNYAVLGESVDPRLTVELDRFNLECNLRPTPLAGRPFAALAEEIDDAVGEVRRAAALHGGRVAVIGILPTLSSEHLQGTAMTDSPRYRALSWAIQRLRREAFQLCINGEDPLEMTCDEITFEGAATSLQVHLRVAPSRFADVYNAVQLATGPVLAMAGNSPTFLGHRLWHETRIALFKQAVDYRGSDAKNTVARVSFGSGWVEDGAFELFAEDVAIHEPLLPLLGDEDPLDCLRAGGVPLLEEMRLHQGTVWRWNRAIYDPAADGHLRIEMRSFPAGPTTADMVANAAFQIGLALGLAPDAAGWIHDVPFAVAAHNFYRAAQSGIEARLLWPPAPRCAPRPWPARALALELLPLARRGLVDAGVEGGEVDAILAVIARRAETAQTGSVWQRATLGALGAEHDRPAALSALLERYLALATSGDLVHDWPVEG